VVENDPISSNGDIIQRRHLRRNSNDVFGSSHRLSDEGPERQPDDTSPGRRESTLADCDDCDPWQ